MSVFYEHVMKEAREISNILGVEVVEVPMLTLTPQQIADYDEATHCGHCNEPFSGDKNKVHHHCLVTGNYLFAACIRCNLQLKQNKRQCVREPKHPSQQSHISCHSYIRSADCHAEVSGPSEWPLSWTTQ